DDQAAAGPGPRLHAQPVLRRCNELRALCSMTAAERWRSDAHEAFSAFDHVEAIAATAVDEALMFPVRSAVSRLLRNDDEFVRTSDGAPGGLPDPRALICVRFAEQFVVDVAGITDADRAMLSGALGSETFTFV